MGERAKRKQPISDGHRSVVVSAVRLLGLAEARERKLKAALKPFANIALERDHDRKAGDMISGPDLSITPADVRRARAAMDL